MLRDIKYALRSLRSTPILTLVSVSTLALSLGSTNALLLVVDAVIWRPLPIADPDHLFLVAQQRADNLQRTVLFPLFERLSDGLSGDSVAVSASGTRTIRVRVADETTLSTVTFVAPNYFQVLEAAPIIGRVLSPTDPAADGEVPVVITQAFWRARFGGIPDVVGRRVELNDVPCVVVGVLASRFQGTRLTTPTELFIPLSMAPRVLPPANYFNDTRVVIDGRGYSPQSWLEVILRCRYCDRDAVKRVEAKATAVLGRAPVSSGGPTVRLINISEVALPPGVRTQIVQFGMYLAAVVTAIWIIACATLISLMLSRSEVRLRDTAVRIALGAPRRAIHRLLLWDATLIGGIGVVLAALVTLVILGTLESFVLPGDIRITALSLDIGSPIIGYAALAAFAILWVTAAAPAALSTRQDVLSTLRAAHPGAGSASRLRSLLVCVQVAVSVMLLVGTALFTRSVLAVDRMNVGPDVHGVYYIAITPVTHSQPLLAAAMTAAVSRVREVPSVASASYGGLPLVSNSGSNRIFRIGGVERALADTLIFDCGPDYFESAGIRLRDGRDFTAEDVAGPPRVVIVNEALARALWPNQSAIGQRLSFLPHLQPLEVIGVAQDGKYVSVGEETRLALYQPWSAASPSGAGPNLVIARTTEYDGRDTVAVLGAAIRASTAAIIPTRGLSMRARIVELTAVQRLGATIITWLGAAALMTAVSGLFGLVSSTIIRRRREIGIRLAVGANPTRVLVTSMLIGLAPLAAGEALGIAGALLLGRFARSFLVGVTVSDLNAYASVTAGTAAIGAAAALVGALAVRRVMPQDVLRAD